MACLGPKPIKVLFRIKFQDGIDKPQKMPKRMLSPNAPAAK
jgi:hypothetical protein